MLPPTAATIGGLASELITKPHECHVILTASLILSILMRLLPEFSARGGGSKKAVAGAAPQGGPEIAIYACPELTAYRRPGLLKSVALRLVSLDERRDL